MNMVLKKGWIAKAITIGLAAMMVISYMYQSTDTVFAGENDTYIVIVHDKEGIAAVKDGYHVVDQNGEALTLEISPSEAAALESKKEILCVEKDFTMGNENEITPDLNKVKPAEKDWNLKAVDAVNAVSTQKVKVAIIDSGVDYSENVLIQERKDFVTDNPVTTPLYEDLTGHGTSVASLLAGTKEDGDVKGLDSNIPLYSARVLVENNQAPVSRVVAAIYWAMEKKVNIINISFGTPVYSEALKTAVDAAAEQGILVVAAAGNRYSWHSSAAWNEGVCNYVANYKYLIMVANRIGNGTDDTQLTASSVKGLRSDCFSELKKGIGTIKKHSTYTKYTTLKNKRAFMMGVAMHTATDAFAHSAFEQSTSGSWSWSRILHPDADDETHIARRVQMAYAVERNVVARFNNQRGNEKIGNDLHADTGGLYDSPIGFRLNKIWTFASAADVTKPIIETHFKKLQGL